jgi:ribosomal RNA-processing protein 8
MFAVTGWSVPTTGPVAQVDSAIKKKTKRGKSKKDFATGSNSVDVTPEVAAKIKQREREFAVEAEKQARVERGETGTQVNPENIDKLWKKVIEGVEPEAEQKSKKRKRGSSGGKKNRENGEKGEMEETEDKEEKEQGPPPKKKTLKEKKREKKAAALAAANGEELEIRESAPKLIASKTVVEDISKLTPLQQKMRAKLTSARFRHINETLYTTPSTQSLELFKTQPEMYQEYHSGFRQQVSVWPSNPVDTFIGQLRSRNQIKFQKGYSKTLNSTSVLPLPRDRDTGICTVADLGCGDAKIAATFNHGKGQKEKIKVLSYDLQASTTDVTVADIANLPLKKESVDVVIFCLALMGTNFLSFVEEAHRILKWRGELWVAEIKSRFNLKEEGVAGHMVGRKKGQQEDAEAGDEPEMEGGEKRGVPRAYKNFVDALSKRGFVLKGGVDDENKMFVRMEFVKQPEAGANGDGEDEMEGRAALGGKAHQAMLAKKAMMTKTKKGKFIENELKEDQIMKPCMYKIR